MKPRLIAELVGVGLMLLLISVARCEGEKSGRIEEQLTQSVAQEAQHRKSAQQLLKVALNSKRETDSIKGRLEQANAQVRDKTRKYASAREAYGKLRDSAELLSNPELLEAADSVISLADSTIAAHEARAAVQSLLIAKQQSVIGLLDAVITAKDGQIRMLNQTIKLQARAKPSRLQSLTNAAKWTIAGAVVGYGLAR